MANERYIRKLSSKEKKFVFVPANIILKEKHNKMLVPLICYLQIRRGMDDVSLISINDAVAWMKKKINYNPKGINQRLLEALHILQDEGYIKLLGTPEHKQFTKVKLNNDKIMYDKCDDRRSRYAVLYLDEIEKIINTEIEDTDNYFKREMVLVVFAWLRMIIAKRIKYSDEIEQYPETFYSYYKCIADNLDISERAVSKAVNVLSNIELIYFKQSKRYLYQNRWKQSVTFFCNYYRRENDVLVAYGDSYYNAEIRAGERMLKEKIENKGFEQYGDIEIVEQS